MSHKVVHIFADAEKNNFKRLFHLSLYQLRFCLRQPLITFSVMISHLQLKRALK